MKNLSPIVLVLALLVPCAASAAEIKPLTDILGVRLGMSREAVRSGLADVASLEREERRRHEVWTLRDDPRFAALIIGYTKEWTVRVVTAGAKPDGVEVNYADVLDLGAANHKAAGKTHTFTWVTGTPPYSVIAIGGPSKVDYLSIEHDQH